ncbi:MAG: LysR family transcriptional regulator [Alphaproteobacteria bacterium]|nr:LysR family transcriptional regulator [Alphaproteobacteria bacterium]
MRHATFRQLRVFDAIVRNGSFTRAAEEMNLTQPTLSMQIKTIGESIGLPLFERIGNRIHLTDAGRALHALCREMFDSVDRFEMALDDLKGLKRGRLRLAAVTPAEFFLPRLIAPFCNAHPAVEVSLEISNRRQLLERMKANADDLYVFGHPPAGIEVDAARFLDNPLVAVAPAGDPLDGAGRIGLDRLTERPFLLREAGSGTRTTIERFLAGHGLRPRIRMELGGIEAIKQAVLGGLGLSILSRHAVENTPGLVILDVEHLPIERHWYLLRLTGKRMSVVAGAFCAHLAQATQSPELAAWSRT